MLALIVGVSWVHADPFLRRTARTQLESLLAGLLQGEVHIDRVASLDFGGIVAEGVMVLDPKGRRVLRGKRLSLGLNVFALARGRLHFTHGTLSDVELLAIPSEKAAITLFEAFLPEPSATPSEPSSSPLEVVFDHIHVLRASLNGSVPGLANLRARDVEAHGRIAIDNDLHVQVSQVSAQLVEPYERPLSLVQGTFALETGPLLLSHHFRVRQGDEVVRGALSYKGAPSPAGNNTRADDALDLVLSLEPISAELLLNLGITVAQVLVPTVRGTVRLSGATRALSYAAALETEAGVLSAHGSFPEHGGVDLHFESPELKLGQLIAYFPPVDLSLRVSARAGPGQPVQLDIQAPKLDVLGIGMHDAHVSGYYQADRFHFADARVHYAGGRFDLSGWVDNDADLYVRLRANVPDVGRDPFMRRLGLSAGIVSDLMLARAGHGLSFEGKLQVSHLRYAQVAVDSLVLSGEADFLEDADLPKLRITGSAGNVYIANYPVGDLKFHSSGVNGRYSSTVDARNQDGRTASLALDYEQQGQRQRFVGKRFELALPGRAPWRAQADVTLTPDGVEIDKVQLDSGPQHLSMSGTFSYSKAYRVDAVLKQFDIGGLRELLQLDLADLDGTVDGKLALTGVPHHPRIDGWAILSDGQFLGMQHLTLGLTLVFVEGRFDLDTDLTLPDKSRIYVTTAGEPGPGVTWLDQIANGNYQFGLDFEKVPFAVAKPWLVWLNLEPPPGTISAMLRGAGNFRDPQLEFTSHIEDIDLGEYRKLDFDVAAAHDGQHFSVQKLAVADEHGALGNLRGSIDATLAELMDIDALRASLATRRFDLAVATPRRRLDELPVPLRVDAPIPAIASLHLAQSAQGPTLDLDAQLGFPTAESGVAACDGSLHRPELALHLHAAAGRGEGNLELKLDGQGLGSAKLHAEVPLAAWLTGATAIAPPRTGLSLSASTLASEELPILCNYVAGPIKLEANAEDIFAQPPRVHLALRSSALQLAAHESQRQRLGSLRNAHTMGKPFSGDVTLDIQGERIAFRALLKQPKAGSLTLSGTLPSAILLPESERPEGPLPVDFGLDARGLELSPFTLALPVPIRSSGQLQGSARLHYDLRSKAVTLAGDLALTRGSLGIAPLGQQLSDVEARLHMQNNVLQLQRLSAHDFDGKVSATGNVTFDTLSQLRLDLALAFADFPIRNEGAQVSKLTGKLALRAAIDAEKTRAELVVKDLRVNLPADLDVGLQDLDPHPHIFVKGQEPPEPPAAPYLFELRLLAQKPPFRVLRSDLNAEVFSDLTVRYLNPQLALQGSAVLKRGNFELYGRRFELQESRIAFANDDQLDPLVNLYAVHKAGKDEIGVRVEGRLSAPKVSFTHSNPAITDTATIIAALLGVRNSDPARQDQLASTAAAGVLAGVTAGLLTERVRREFGGALPVISMDSSGKSLRASRIRAGVQLDQVIEKRLGGLSKVVRGAYVEGFVAPGATSQDISPNAPPQSRGGGLLELRFPADLVGSVEYRPVQNWRVDVAWEP